VIRNLLLFVPRARLRRCSLPLPILVFGEGSAARRLAPPLTWHGCLRFPAHRIHKGVLELLMTDDRFELQGERFVVCGRRDRIEGKLGFRMDARDPGPANDPLLLKLHWVLSSRMFAQTGGRDIEIRVSQLCDDLGYSRLANGAHRPSNKRAVAAALLRLGDLELDLAYKAPNGETTRLRGQVWEIDVDGALLRYQAGAWAADPLWQRFNGAVGLAPADLLSLRPDRDAWAIRLGSYLAALARMNGYRTTTLQVETLLEKTGLGRAEARNPARMRDKLERALERLEEAGCLAGWTWIGDGAEPDMDDPDALRTLDTAAAMWRSRQVQVVWPRPLQAREAVLSTRRPRKRTLVR
jgi:hypothetical protein